jgi:hydrogenase expression/formation protein HypE
MSGKLTPDDLARYVFARTGAPDDRVRVGPSFGEDAAAIDLDAGTLVVSTDPISLAADRIGTLAMNVSANDVAASGGVPSFVTSTILLPTLDPDLVESITDQLDREAKRLGVAIVGGHTEAVPALERPLLSLTCMGPAERYVPTSGAEPGDSVLLTKGAGLEATGVLATDFRERIESGGVTDPAVFDRAESCFGDLSVLPESAVLSPVATAMHDPTEGGVVAGLVELARASGVVLDVDRAAVPVREETRLLCDAVGVDPLRVLGSGALAATVPADHADEVLTALRAEGIEAGEVGRVRAPGDVSDARAGRDGASEASASDETTDGEPGLLLDDEFLAEVPRDEMYRLWD